MNLKLLFLWTTASCSILSFQTKSRGLLYAAASEAVEINSKDINISRDDRISSGISTGGDGLIHKYRYRKLRGYNRRSGGKNKRRFLTPRLTKPTPTDKLLQQQQQAETRTNQLLLDRLRAISATDARNPVAPPTPPLTPPYVSPPTFRFEKVGQRLCGDKSSGYFGYGVYLSDQGKRLAMGSPYYPISSEDWGLVQVFELQLGKWNKIGQDIFGMNPPGLIGDGYASLSGDGNYLGYAPGVRMAFTYRYNQPDPYTDEWALEDSISGWGQDFTAISLSHDGSRIALGKYDTIQLYKSGRNTPLAEVTWSDDVITFMRVALSGDGKRVAGYHHSRREVRVYKYSVKKKAMVMVGLPIITPDDIFIASVSLSNDGSVLAIGGAGSTYALVFEYDGEAWKQKGSNIFLTNDSDTTNNPGIYVSLSYGGDRLIASLVYYEEGAVDNGRVTIYDFYNDKWNAIGSLLNTMVFGVDISPEGNYFAIGSPAKSTDGFTANGCVTVYEIRQT